MIGNRRKPPPTEKAYELSPLYYHKRRPEARGSNQRTACNAFRNRQKEYYASLGQADAQGEATAFVEFMLRALHDTLATTKTDQVTDQVKRLLEVAAQGEKTAIALMRALDLRHAPTFRKNYLTPALQAGLIERTRPDSPRSPGQRYRMTEKGKKALQK